MALQREPTSRLRRSPRLQRRARRQCSTSLHQMRSPPRSVLQPTLP